MEFTRNCSDPWGHGKKGSQLLTILNKLHSILMNIGHNLPEFFAPHQMFPLFIGQIVEILSRKNAMYAPFAWYYGERH